MASLGRTSANPTPSRRQRLAFWLLLGMFSTAFAEVPSGSYPFVLVLPWGIAVTLPLYGLHTLVLAGIVYHVGSKQPRFRTLLLAGALFGLYEAYTTKVLWSPYWDAQPFVVGGVYVWETVVLLFCWHSLVSFVLPLVVVERLATRSRTVLDCLPAVVRNFPRRAAFAVAVFLALVQGATMAGQPGTVLAADAIHLLVLGGAVLLWRRRVGTEYRLAELLPDLRESLLLCAPLALVYLFLTLAMRFDQLPGIDAQATVWVLYLVLGGLFVLDLRRGTTEKRGQGVLTWGLTLTKPDGGHDRGRRAVSLRDAVPVAIVFLVCALVGSLVLGPVGALVFVSMFLVGLVAAVWVVGTGLRDAVRGLAAR
ncbi:hypothetical protein [Haloarchaeobius sp. DFWS5]|uniref:hypothetical protein n=1 Tax=Haloarchaeobius sp. DFWS5 TaxID=3446114 RepID=UPI003EBD6476